MKLRPAALALLLSISLATCAPGEVPTPTPERVQELIEAAFPGSEGEVGEVERLEQQVRAAVQLDGAEMVLVLEAGDDDWAITGIEQGEISYTLEDLARIRATVELMDSVSDALEDYRGANGAFPALDDGVGLAELIPDHYAGDASFSDGWGSPLRYRVQGEDYTLTSSGPDGEPGTPDDVILVTGRFER